MRFISACLEQHWDGGVWRGWIVQKKKQVKKEGECQQDGADCREEGGGRDRLKRVSKHDIPVLTPQLFREVEKKMALWPQKCTTIWQRLGKC